MCEQDLDALRQGKELLPFEIGYIPDAFLKQVEEELNETPARRMHNMRVFRDLMKKDEAFKDEYFDDRFLLQYLRFRKHDVTKAFNVLRNFVNFRKKCSTMFSDCHNPIVVKIVSEEIATILPSRCPEGCAIMLVQCDNWNPESLPLEYLKKGIMMLLSQGIREPLTQVTGFKVIFDTESNPMLHLRFCTFTNLYEFYYGSQETSSGRFKSIHVINPSLLFTTCWTVLKPFLPSKMKKRIHVHKKNEDLFNYFPRAVIPVKYGGHLRDYDMTEWFKRVTEFEETAVLLGLRRMPSNS